MRPARQDRRPCARRTRPGCPGPVSYTHLDVYKRQALNFYETVRREGTQKHIVDTLQTRAELYDFLGYHAYEDKLDALFAREK